ncbi:MAG: orotidine-5'-phosphate decarboxylase [Candidatus Edwardsbacteria bacterium]
MLAQDCLIVALDVPTFQEAKQVITKLKNVVNFFKVGSQLYTSVGPKIVEFIKDKGAKVFLDLKFHDIPNTVAKASEAAVKLGVDMFNLHTLGGFEMMECAAKTVWNMVQNQEKRRHPIVLGVTILTSVDDVTLKEVIGVSERTIEEEVLLLAGLAQSAGLDGVVASPQEIAGIKKKCGQEFIVLTPGIRPSGIELNDQKRVMTPGEAIKVGADYLVVGRPITKAKDPIETVQSILKEIENAESGRNS